MGNVKNFYSFYFFLFLICIFLFIFYLFLFFIFFLFFLFYFLRYGQGTGVEQKKVNIMKMLSTKNKLVIYNKTSDNLKLLTTVKQGNKVQFYVRLYYNHSRARILKVKTVSDIPTEINSEFMKNI